MKYFWIFLSLLITTLLVALFLLFTQSGNNIIKPYIKNILQKKLQKDVNIEAFTLKTNFIDLELTVDKNSRLIVNGNFNMLDKTVDVDYIVDAKDIQTPYVNIEGLLHVEGKVKGELDDFQANGKGVAFNSKINFLTNIQNKKIQAIKLNAKNVKIENILSFLKKPIYSRGLIDIDMDVKPKENNNFFGNSNVTIHYGTLNRHLLEKDFGLNLYNTVTYRGTIKSTIYGNKVHTKTDIYSNVAKIDTKNTQYDINKNILYSDYTIQIPKLSAIEKNIQGSITLDGNIEKTEDDFSFDINSKTLGGTLKVIGFNDTLKVDAKKIKLELLNDMLKQPHYSKGEFDLSLNMQDTKKLSRDGLLILHVNNATLYVNEFMKTKTPTNINYKLSLTGDIKQNNISISANILSDIAQLDITKSNYDIPTNTLEGKYTLDIDDLNNLYFVTNRPLKGNIKVIGNYKLDKHLYIDGNSQFLDAQTIFELKNNNLHIKSDELSIVKATDMLYYPKVFDSFATLEADYNISNEIGVVSLNALNGKLIKSELTEIIHLLMSRYNIEILKEL